MTSDAVTWMRSSLETMQLCTNPSGDNDRELPQQRNCRLRERRRSRLFASLLPAARIVCTAFWIGAESPPVRAQLASTPCGESVLLRVSDEAPRQGDVLVVEVRSDNPLEVVEGFSAGEELFFWHGADARVYQALLGIDLHRRPGASSVRVSAIPDSGAAVECRLELRIVDGDFPVQRLRVAPKYVQLSSEDLARAQRESRELNGIFASVTPERLWRDGFEHPVSGYEASGSFGKRRVFNDEPRSPHSGEDFSAPAGTPVVSTARGRVVLAKELFFLGNTVIVDHGFGLYTFYGHLSSLSVSSGTLVESGATLGQVGATGRVTGAHLHWGVRLGDKRVNPMELITLTR